MPGDPFPISRHFAEEVRAPATHVLADQVLDASHNTGIRQDVVNTSMTKVRRADGIAVAPCGKRPSQQLIKVTTDAGYLFCIEDPNAGQVTIAVESCNLLRGQSRGMLGRRRMKPQIAVKLVQFFVARDEPGSSQRFHSSNSVSRDPRTRYVQKCTAEPGLSCKPTSRLVVESSRSGEDMRLKTLAATVSFVLMTLNGGARAQRSVETSPAWNDNSLIALQ